jgi:hypothetical protein
MDREMAAELAIALRWVAAFSATNYRLPWSGGERLPLPRPRGKPGKI